MDSIKQLSSQVLGIPKQQLEGIFLNGLTQEIREVVHISKPRNLPEMKSMALQMESTSLYHMVCRDRQWDTKKPFGNSTALNRSVGEPQSQVGWKMKSIPIGDSC